MAARSPLSGFLLLVLAGASSLAHADDWSRPDTTGLSRTVARVEPGADAECLLREVRISDEIHEMLSSEWSYHFRIKVYTDRGRETRSTVTIPHDRRVEIVDLVAHTIEPDGTVIPVDRDAIFSRELVRSKGLKAEEVSFSFPDVRPGAILEYKYREIRHDQASNYLSLDFGSDLPTWRCTFFVRPLQLEGVQMRYRVFGRGISGFVPSDAGFHRAEGLNLAADREEPLSPDAEVLHPWILVYYQPTGDADVTPDRYWRDFDHRLFDDFRSRTRLNPEGVESAKRAVGDAHDPEEQLLRLYRWCRSAVTVVDPGSGARTPHAHANAGEILAFGAGSPNQLGQVFAAGCRAVGIDARLALLADRRRPRPSPEFLNPFLFRDPVVAVRMADSSWAFFDPGDRLLAPGFLRWQQEGVPGLITDADRPMWVTTAISQPALSSTTRTGAFRLDEDGNLEGDVRDVSTGHRALDWREALDGETPAEREKEIVSRVTARLGSAVVTGVAFEGLDDCEPPVTIRYHLRVPGYATSTGSRMLLQPEVFAHGSAALFTLETRRHPIEFPYPWVESDSIRIDVPPSLTIEAGSAPIPLRASDLGFYTAGLETGLEGHSLTFARQLVFGLDGGIDFPTSSYAALKTFFAGVSQRDEFLVTLTRAEGGK